MYRKKEILPKISAKKKTSNYSHKICCKKGKKIKLPFCITKVYSLLLQNLKNLKTTRSTHEYFL